MRRDLMFFAVLVFLWLVFTSGCSCQFTAYNRQDNEQRGCPCQTTTPAEPERGG